MAVYNNKESILVISGYEIKEFESSGDVINIAFSNDAGEYTIGTNGNGVFVTNGNDSGSLTVKLLQHSADNKFMNDLFNQQRNSIKTFTPLEMYFKDLTNGDVVTGTKGYFTTKAAMSRGDGHNPYTWTIQFERVKMQIEKGLHN